MNSTNNMSNLLTLTVSPPSKSFQTKFLKSKVVSSKKPTKKRKLFKDLLTLLDNLTLKKKPMKLLLITLLPPTPPKPPSLKPPTTTMMTLMLESKPF